MPFSNTTGRDRAKLTLRVILGGYIAFSAMNAQAADPRLQAAFGNTVVSTYPDGRSQKVWLKPDGTWEGLSRRGSALAGKWTAKEDKVCLRQTKPATLPVSFCTPFPAKAEVGVQWTGKDFSGAPIKLSLQKGMAK